MNNVSHQTVHKEIITNNIYLDIGAEDQHILKN